MPDTRGMDKTLVFVSLVHVSLPLTQKHSTNNKLGLMLGKGRGRCTVGHIDNQLLQLLCQVNLGES